MMCSPAAVFVALVWVLLYFSGAHGQTTACYCPCADAEETCDGPGGNCNIVNVARGKEASMSAPYAGTGPASMAVDGDTSTSGRHCIHTLGDQDSVTDFWQVDLGRDYTISNITIYHREGGAWPNPHTQRISGVWIYVDNVLCYQFPDSPDVGSDEREKDDITCSQPIRGRVVRFSKDGYIHHKHYSFINFCEVQIWVCKSGWYGQQCQIQCSDQCGDLGCDNYDGTCLVATTTAVPSTTEEETTEASSATNTASNNAATYTDGQTTTAAARETCQTPGGNCNIVNVARGKEASMSAPYAGTGPASMAVDGDTNTLHSRCIHTLGDQDSVTDFWQVDLGRVYTITNITIYHRRGGGQFNPHTQRISGIWIYVDNALCYQFPDSPDVGSDEREKDDITCSQPIRGRVVRFSKDGYIHHKHYSFINFCEVQIWVCKSGWYGQQCQGQCSDQCGDLGCDNYDGTCLVATTTAITSITEEESATTEASSAVTTASNNAAMYTDGQTTTADAETCDTPGGNCNIVNMAKDKEASMSAPYAGSGPASLAVDGDANTHHSRCIHTQGDEDSVTDFWQVDLGRDYTITNITIYHREGGWWPNPHTQRISGIWIYVDNVLCYQFPDSVYVGSDERVKDDITCSQPIRGRVVRFSKDGNIHRKHYSFINFCEVQIWVCKSGWYGQQCHGQCSDQCGDLGCDNYDGTCLTAATTVVSSITEEESSPTKASSSASPLLTSAATLTHPATPSEQSKSSSSASKIHIIKKKDNSSKRNKEHQATSSNSHAKYTDGDMVGVAVMMVLVGLAIGVVGFGCFIRFRARRGGVEFAGIPFVRLN